MNVCFNAQGLVPAIAQDARTGRVLMMAWMDEQALAMTLKTGQAHYYSRSRQKLWRKGETSGHTQEVVDVRLDCDGDTLLLLVNQVGPACHTNETSCLFYVMDSTGTVSATSPPSSSIIERVQSLLKERRNASTESSYTARLLAKGVPAISDKVTEEAEEFNQALANESDNRVVSEAADVLFHMLVGLEARGIDHEQVLMELSRRFGTSGIEEKAARNTAE